MQRSVFVECSFSDTVKMFLSDRFTRKLNGQELGRLFGAERMLGKGGWSHVETQKKKERRMERT